MSFIDEKFDAHDQERKMTKKKKKKKEELTGTVSKLIERNEELESKIAFQEQF